MNFFNSVFADDPDPPNYHSESESEPGSHCNPEQEHPDSKSPPRQPNPDPSGGSSGGWMFGDLIKTLATKSESVLETYRRDLQEFGSGLKKEIEVAQGSLETVGNVLDEFGNTVLKGTAQMISEGTDAILAPDHESDSSVINNQALSPQQGLNSRRYSRFDVQVRAIEADASTYCVEPEDLGDYEKWRSGFAVEDKSEEIEGLFEENGAMEAIYNRVVPSSVDHETFWCRYFYRVYKLRQAENVRVNLVKRAISTDEDEELSWDVDDEEYDEKVSNVVSKAIPVKITEVAAEDSGEVEKVGKVEDLTTENEVGEKRDSNLEEKRDSNLAEISKVSEETNVAMKNDDTAANRELISKESEQKNVKEESSSESLSQVVDEKGVKSLKTDNEKKGNAAECEKKMEEEEDLPSKSEEKVVALGGKNLAPESGKNNEASSVVSMQSPAPEEEDLGWDEIEDLSSIDDKQVSNVGSVSSYSNNAELRRKLSAAEEEEEDLSWDIEDDDDVPAKA